MKKTFGSKTLSIFLALGFVFTLVSLKPMNRVSAAGTIYRVIPGGLTTGDCGDTSANACDLQYALQSKAVSGDELWVKAGTYKPTTTADRTLSFVLKSGVALYGGFAGTETSRDERDWEENVTILSGDIGTVGDSSDNSYHVVTGSEVDNTAVLDGFTITAGTANGNDPQNNGGGMYNDNANPTLTNVTFSLNSASSYGGGMSNWNSSSPTLTNVTFSGNSANSGGGMSNSQSNTVLMNVAFYDNTAYRGGGMFNSLSNSTLTNVTFTGNTASNGGGMINIDQSIQVLTKVTFRNNTANDGGGGMYNYYNSLTLTNVTFSGNSATHGGGMDNILCIPLTLTNVTFSGNSATEYGGAMYNYKIDIYHGVIKNAILWGDSASNGTEIYNDAGRPYISTSDVQGCGGSGNWNDRCGFNGGGNLDADPLLGTLGDYGGAMQTLPLLPGSAAIDTGDVSICPEEDQRGITRPQGPGCDMGAYESRGFTLTQVSGDEQVALVNTPFAEPLVVGVSSEYGEPVEGGVVTFTAPNSGASTIPQTSTVAISSGTASQSMTANDVGGTYSVNANNAGATMPVMFTLHNKYKYLHAAPVALGSEDCSSWANACTLQMALAGSINGNEIWVQEGVHFPGTVRTDTFMLKNDVEIYGGFAGTETSREDRDWETNVTILSGDIGTPGSIDDNSYHVVTGSGTNSTAVLNGFTISGGNADGADSNGTGGGMYNDKGSPALENVNFSGNSGTYGGGICNSNNSNPTLVNVIFSSNTATYNGGGMHNYQSSPALVNVTFSSNTATYYGGGMNNYRSSPALTNVLFSMNISTYYGGGIYNTYSNPTMMNVTISGNTAGYDGGGIYNNRSSPSMKNITFSGNAATSGGGMYNYYESSTPVIENTILWGDSATNGAEIYNSESTTTIFSSDIQGCGGSGNWNDSCGIDGGGNLDADPLLGALGDYGGFTQTLPLLPGSAAIDAGNDASCSPTDQRGVERPQGTGCDMGAYESHAFFFTKISGDMQGTVINTNFGEPLVVRVSGMADQPVDGGLVTFTAPASGPSAVPQMSTVRIESGLASLNLAANDISGTYSVTANASGLVGPVEFTLRNMLSNITYAATEARGSGDCSSWANACILQTALDSSFYRNEIWVEAGVYYPGTSRSDTFALRSDVEIYGGFAGIETSREQRDWIANVTILSGDIGTGGDNSDNCYHVVTGNGTNGTAVLDGFNISGGNADGSWLDSFGGGIYNYGSSPTLVNLVISGNHAINYGGGMVNYESSNPTLANIVFSNNSAKYGGGISNFQVSSPTLADVTINNNSADQGGGMYNDYSNPTLKNVTFVGNSANKGGGLYNYFLSKTNMINVTYHLNSAVELGGGIYNYSHAECYLRNSILWGDSAPNNSEIYNGYSSTTIYSSDIQGCMPGGVWNSACGTNGGGNIDADPLLGTLGDYGGFTQTLPLLPGSAAIDAGNDASCSPTDQRGIARPQGAGCDMGAYESRGFILTKVSGDMQSALINTAFAEPLVVSVSSAFDEPVDGGVVTFTAPVSGPSAIPQKSMVTISEGSASQSLTANGEGGEYSVMVGTAGAIEPSEFMLKNLFGIYLPVIIR